MSDVTVKREDARAIYENLRGQLPVESASDIGDFDSWTDPDDALHAVVDEITERSGRDVC